MQRSAKHSVGIPAHQCGKKTVIPQGARRVTSSRDLIFQCAALLPYLSCRGAVGDEGISARQCGKKPSSLEVRGAFVLQRFACFGHSFTKFALTTVQAHKVNFARHPKTTF